MTWDNDIDVFHLNNDGEMTSGTGWVPSDGNLYYIKDDGSVAINWQIINDNWYYFYPNSDDNSHIEGSMAENTIINGDYINNDGKWIKDYTDEDEEYIGDGLTNKVTNGAAVTVTDDLDDDSESLFDKAKSDIRDFTMGAGYSVDNNMYYGITTHVAGMDSDTLPDSTACKAGKVVGDIASIAGGTAEVAAGAGMEGAGIVADGTGVAVVPGLALNASGAVVVVNGGVTVYRSTGNLANDTMSLISSDGEVNLQVKLLDSR